MSRFRSRWLALFGGVTLIALSLSTAFAGKPDGENRGQQVSAYVHSLAGDVEENEEADEETEEDPEVEEEDSAPSDHGKCVAAVAQDPEAVGPPNDNHGGAVSEAARVTCWDDSAPEGEGDSEESDSEGADDADASDTGSGHGNGHGHAHGGDSSED